MTFWTLVLIKIKKINTVFNRASGSGILSQFETQISSHFNFSKKNFARNAHIFWGCKYHLKCSERPLKLNGTRGQKITTFLVNLTNNWILKVRPIFREFLLTFQKIENFDFTNYEYTCGENHFGKSVFDF